MSNENLKTLVNEIESHLSTALSLSQQMQEKVHASEADSDLFRKLSFYLTPSLDHWINGEQAGGMKDLKSLLDKRK